MIGGEHTRAFDSVSGQHSDQPTSSRPENPHDGKIWSNDATSTHPPETSSQDFNDVDPYYRRPNTMVDTESQYSEGTMVATRQGGFSRRFSRFTVWQQLSGKGRKKVGWISSLKAIVTFTCKPEL
jgi:hypothetical protein